jgi:hypothetical protein
MIDPMTVEIIDQKWQGRTGWATRWKPPLKEFAIAFEGRIN